MNKDKTEYTKMIIIARLRKWDISPFWKKFNSPKKVDGGEDFENQK